MKSDGHCLSSDSGGISRILVKGLTVCEKLTVNELGGSSQNLGQSALIRPFTAVNDAVVVGLGAFAVNNVYVDNIREILTGLRTDCSTECNLDRELVLESESSEIRDLQSLDTGITRLPLFVIEHLVLGLVLQRYPIIVDLVKQIDLQSTRLDRIARTGYGVGKPSERGSHKRRKQRRKKHHRRYQTLFQAFVLFHFLSPLIFVTTLIS